MGKELDTACLFLHLRILQGGVGGGLNLKGICQDFENFVNVLWIRSLIHVDLVCERNFEIGFIL